jgi:AraC-like DNA-binding protein
MKPPLENTPRDDFACSVLPCEGPLARYCTALVAVDVAARPDVELTIIPHESFVLSLQFAQGTDPFARGVERGLLPQACGWRPARYSYRPGGDCRTFFALLTPEGAVALAAGQPPPGGAQPRAPLAHLLERAALVALEDALAREAGMQEQLRHFARWVEDTLAARRQVPWQALRAARVAASMFAAPVASIDAFARAEGLSRRQVERDFRLWLNAVPKHMSLLARVQAAARLGLQGHALAEIAHRLGFVDQSHMNRVVRNMTGLTPPALARSARTGLSQALRAATCGGLVYL